MHYSFVKKYKDKNNITTFYATSIYADTKEEALKRVKAQKHEAELIEIMDVDKGEDSLQTYEKACKKADKLAKRDS